MITITITKEHLEKALAVKRGDRGTENCVLAQAVRAASFHDPKDRIICGFSQISVNSTQYLATNPDVPSLVQAFDEERFDKVESMLPMTTKLEKID